MVTVALRLMRFAPVLTMFVATLALACGPAMAQRGPDDFPYPIETAKPAVKSTAKPEAKKHAAAPAEAQLPSVKPAEPKTNTAKKAEPATDVFAGIPRDERLKLQAALLWSGDYPGAANSDDPMLTAVKNFQKRKKYKVTGVLTEAERADLLSAAKNHEDEFGWTVVADPATGIRIGLPTKMVPVAHETEHGTRWSSRHGDVQVETFRVSDPDLKLSKLFEEEKKAPTRTVEYSTLRNDGFFISGMQGLKKFSVRATMRDGEVRGFTMMFDQAMEGIVTPVMVAMASAFSPFPQRSAPFAALAKSVEYGNGLVVSEQGHIVTDAHLVHGCQVLVAVGLGDAERVAENAGNGLALLRVYGPRQVYAGGVDAKPRVKTADVTLAGIPDPKEHDGSGKLTEIKARLADGNSIELRQPVPMAGFSGAAALNDSGHLIGIAELRNAVLASNAPAVPPVRLVRADTIREFLNVQHVPLPAKTANARDADRAGYLRDENSRLLILPLRLPLFDEGLHAFLLIVGRKQRVENPRSKRTPSAKDDSNATLTASLPASTDGSDILAIVSATFIASSIRLAAGTTRATRLERSASAASIMRPVKIISIALALPTARVSRCVPPIPGMTPSLISGWPNLALSAAMMRSHCIASSQPPPSAKPATAATIGLRARTSPSQSAQKFSR